MPQAKFSSEVMHMKVRLVMGVSLAGVLLLTSSCAVRRRAGAAPPPAAIAAASVLFTNQERALILNWFRDHRAGLPPGLAKRDRLPPGLEKQLQQRGQLPPGLEKRMHPLPFELERQLSGLPAGYVRVVIGASVVLMNQETRIVADIIRSAVQ